MISRSEGASIRLLATLPILLASVSLPLAACGGGSEGPTGPDDGEGSDTSPSVTLTDPASGSAVWSTVEVTADASDDGTVVRVEFFVDGGSIGVDADPADGWSSTWNTTEVADGNHTVSAAATDDAGQTATDENTVSVENGSESEQWTRRASLGGAKRDRAVAFSIVGKGYVGIGQAHGTAHADVWAYDPATDSWTQVADFGGGPRQGATAFAAGGRGYVGTGISGGEHQRDFWEYDPGTNTWTRIADFGGSARRQAVGFSIGDMGYVGMGDESTDAGGQVADLWEYDPSTGRWTQRADLPGEPRQSAVAFAFGGLGYVGTGWNSDHEDPFRDFWSYDPSTDSWTQRADFGGAARLWATGFALDGRGYLGIGTRGGGSQGSGTFTDLWEYDPSADGWVQMDDWPSSGRLAPVGFTAGERGYLGTGWDGTDANRDLWEFTPPSEVGGSSRR